ncbi:MAG: hypothetical protein JSS02_35055 [Planctomycetes bacterium]|nr:hypothetical protein [Planctomycetota bacterium]
MRSLITGSSTFFAPLLIRGLGQQAVEVTAADSRWISMGKWSRYTARQLRLPRLAVQPEQYLEAVVRELKSAPYDFVLPAFEESLLLSEYRDEVEPHAQLFLPAFQRMWQVHHKPSLYRLCLDLQIPAPPTIVPSHPDQVEAAVSALQFPVVLKLPAANNCVGRKFCDNLPELTGRFAEVYAQETRRGSAPPFVQQKIEGEPVYTLMFCHQGQKLGEVIYRPLRTFPERGGTSAHRESIVHPRIAELTERLARATSWSGFLGLDFLVDHHNETPYLIDANPRANPGVQLGFLAGVDWTGIVLDLVRGRRPDPVTARPGVRTRSFLTDCGWFLEGCAPQRNWWQQVQKRWTEYRNPDWELTARSEFWKNGERACTVAMACQGISAVVRSLVTGRQIGETMLDDVNYDAVAAARMRETRSTPQILSLPQTGRTSAKRQRKAA